MMKNQNHKSEKRIKEKRKRNKNSTTNKIIKHKNNRGSVDDAIGMRTRDRWIMQTEMRLRN